MKNNTRLIAALVLLAALVVFGYAQVAAQEEDSACRALAVGDDPANQTVPLLDEPFGDAVGALRYGVYAEVIGSAVVQQDNSLWLRVRAPGDEGDFTEGYVRAAQVSLTGDCSMFTGLPLPDWADQLAFGVVSLSAFVWAATELTKRVLQMFGLLEPEWGRYIMAGWTIGFVILALGAQIFQVEDVVTEGVEWIYQAMLLILTLFGAPTLHRVAKETGLVRSATPDNICQ